MTVPFPCHQSRCAQYGRQSSGYPIARIAPDMNADQCLRTRLRHSCNSCCAVSCDGRAHRARIVPEISWPCAMQSPAPQVTTSGPPCIGPAVFVYPASRCQAWLGIGGGNVSGVRFPHVLITSNSSRQPAKPNGIAVSGVLSVGQYVFVAKEKNTATVCGVDSVRPRAHFGRCRCFGMAANVAAGSMRRGREKYVKDNKPGPPAQPRCIAKRA